MKFRFTIGRKIGTGFGILIFLTITAFVLTQFTLNKSRKITDEVTDVYSPSVSALEDLNFLIVKSKALIASWIFYQQETNPDKLELRKLIDTDYPKLRIGIEKLSANWSIEEKNQITSIFNSIDSLFSAQKEIMIQLNSFSSYEDPAIKFLAENRVYDSDGDVYMGNLTILDNLSKLITIQHENARHVTNDMLDSFDLLQFIVRSLGFALLIGGVLIALFTVRTIVRPIYQLKRILLFMGKGILPVEKIQDRDDEIGEMSVALNGLVEGLRGTTEFANEVGGGNFESYYKPLSEDDTLGYALLKMRKDLRENERVLEAKVIERTEEVVRQKEKIEVQNQKLEILYKHVTDSIKYAKRIQEAILPPHQLVRELLPNAFVLYKPKDIVSGDFYWIYEKDGKTLFAAVDCTGHGVPGAFMSIVGHNLLKQVVTNIPETEPAVILDRLNEGVSETLRQSNEEASAKDGMDLSLCSIDYKTLELQYAGAYNPLYLIRDGKLIEIKADKFPIGFFVGEKKNKFTNHKIQLQKGDCIYIFSDGYSDQFGGPNGKKFMANRFRNLLLTAHQYPVEEQKNLLEKTIEEWRGSLDQVDDILVMGLKM